MKPSVVTFGKYRTSPGWQCAAGSLRAAPAERDTGNRLVTKRMIFLRRASYLFAAILIAFAVSSGRPTAAFAQSSQCLQLVNQLAAIDSGGGFGGLSPRYQQYERAVRDQEAQIAKTENAARQNRCGGFSLFGRNANLCARINSSLNQMYANLSRLRRQKARLAPSSGAGSSQRNAILSEMSRLGCQMRGNDRQQFTNNAPRDRRRSLVEQIFGVRTVREDGYRTGTAFGPDLGLADQYGTFRTLCVRTCDGYYFPISFSTVAQRFDDDEQTCQAMCPGSNVELFYHRMPAQDSEDMISYRTSTPYVELPKAFSYRKEFQPECACRSASTGLTEIAGSGGFQDVNPQGTTVETGPKIATPVFKMDPGLDPDTLMNVEGGLTVADIDALARSQELGTPVASQEKGERNVRIVGPSFFPVQ